MATSKSVEVIEIRPIEIKRATVRIVGDTPLIMHAWSEKAKREMLEKQMKVKDQSKSRKRPDRRFYPFDVLENTDAGRYDASWL